MSDLSDKGRGLLEKSIAGIDYRRDELASLLAEMVRFPSVTGPTPGDEGPIQQWMAERLANMGAEVDMWDVTRNPWGEPLTRVRPNVVGTWSGKGEGHSLIINGHVDVVPDDDAGWTHPPFAGVVADGFVWGRGSVDMKGGLASALFAVQVLLEEGWRPAGSFSLHSVMGEESGEAGSWAAVAREHGADAAIIPEPTDLIVRPLEGGFHLLVMTVEGTPGHTCDRWKILKGENEQTMASAIDKGVILLGVLRSVEEQWSETKRHPLFPQGWPTIGVNVLKGGSSFGSIPASFEAECAIWYLPHEDAVSVREEIEGALQVAIQNDPWLRNHPPRLEWKIDYPPAVTPEDHPLVTTLTKALAEVSGRSTAIQAFQAASDMRWITTEHGIPSTLFGPGTLAQAHATDERIAVRDLVVAAQTLARCLVDWCGHRG